MTPCSFCGSQFIPSGSEDACCSSSCFEALLFGERLRSAREVVPIEFDRSYSPELREMMEGDALRSARSRFRNMVLRAGDADFDEMFIYWGIIDVIDLGCSLCGYAVMSISEVHVDHIHPVSFGGRNTMDNIMFVCARCNLRKSMEDGSSPLGVQVEDDEMVADDPTV